MNGTGSIQDAPDPESQTTGLPLLHSWRAVYLLVSVIVTIYLVTLALLTRSFQ